MVTIVFLTIITIILVMLLVLFLSRFCFWAQYVYMCTFARWSGQDEWSWYKQAKDSLELGKNVPVIYLKSYTRMRVYNHDEGTQFLNEYPLYFVVFPDKDICLYSNDRIVICSFWNLSLYHLMKIAGSSDPKKAIQYIIQQGEKEQDEFDQAQQEKLSNLLK